MHATIANATVIIFTVEKMFVSTIPALVDFGFGSDFIDCFIFLLGMTFNDTVS